MGKNSGNLDPVCNNVAFLCQVCLFVLHHFKLIKVNKGAKIRNRYNQVPHLTQDTNGKVTNSQLDTTNESQEVSPLKSIPTEVQA